MYTIVQRELIAWLRENQWLARSGYLPKANAILADPPYFLASIVERFGKANAAPTKGGKDGSFKRLANGFMHTTWDSFEDVWAFQEWVTEWSSLLLDFVYPGAMGAFFGGSRTGHRLAAGLEDAGWEIVDVVMWVTAQGLSKGTEVTRYFEHKRRGTAFLKSIANNQMGRHTLPDRLKWRRLEKQWSGYKPTLRPAYEPIVIVRAPRQGLTYAECAEQYGTAHFDIDRNRINGRYPTNVILQHAPECGTHCVDHCPTRPFDQIKIQSGGDVTGDEPSTPAGSVVYGNYRRQPWTSYKDAGALSRMFFQAKAGAFERVAGLPEKSNHPTVKPLMLVEHLARLMGMPPQDQPRRILIPFAGIGSEMLGAYLSGNWEEIVGVEQSVDYVRQARQRLEWWSQYRTYAQAEEAYKRATKGEKKELELASFGQLGLWSES